MRISIIIAFFFLWELAVRVGWIDGFIFSSPVRIWETMMSMGKDGSLWMHTRATLFETMISFFLTVLLGILTAVLLWCSDSAAEITEPFFVVLNSLPKSALAQQAEYAQAQKVGGKYWDPSQTFGELIAQGTLAADDDAAIQEALDNLVEGVTASVE